jgi:hypothetical protein
MPGGIRLSQFKLSQKRLVQATVDAEDLASRFCETIAQEQEDRLGLVRRCNRLFQKRPLGVELGKTPPQHIIAIPFRVDDLVLRE